MYENFPELRQLFASLPDNHFFLFEKIDRKLWPELVSYDYNILNRDGEKAGQLIQILQTLSHESALEALRYMNIGTRLRVIEGLTPESKDTVTKRFTENEIERMERARDNPEDHNHFIATKGFIETLPITARECFNEECVAMGWGKDFEDYNPFVIARCFKHSFHIACATEHDCD
jgi:hypothetical protein